MLVLVVGATGVLGHETVRCLRAAGHRVRGMTRRVQRMRDLESLGVEPVIGDLTERASLVRACAGVETKRRNFVAARDVAVIAKTVLTGEMPRERVLAIGGPGNFTNDEVARMYSRIAGVPARIVHVPRAALGAIGFIARPFHPGIARVMRLSSLRDDAFPETFDARDSAGENAVGPTTMEEFVRERVREHRAVLEVR